MDPARVRSCRARAAAIARWAPGWLRQHRADLVAAAGDLPSLLQACDEHRPDVVVTGIEMPPTDTDEGIRLAERLRERAPGIGVIVVAHSDEPRYALPVLANGSPRRGYLVKERLHNRAELTAAIRAVAGGASAVDPMLARQIAAVKLRTERSPLRDLTARERDVLDQIAEATSNCAIAASLSMTKRAVEKHIDSIFLKLGLTDATDSSKRVKAALMRLEERAIGETGG